MLSILAAALMQAAALAPAVTTPPRPSVITNPDWLSKPTGQDMARFYPKAAAAAHVEGRVVLRCSVIASGDLTGCTTSGEDPPGQGFAEAALGLSTLFKMKPMTKDGLPVSGGKVNIPIKFGLPAPPTSPDLALRCYGYAAAEAERNPTSASAQAAVLSFGWLIQMTLFPEHARPSEVAEVLAAQQKIAAAKLDDSRFKPERDECAAALSTDMPGRLQRALANLPR